MKIPLARGARTGTLVKSAKKAGLAAKWAETPIAKKLAMRSLRANLTECRTLVTDLRREASEYQERQRALEAQVRTLTAAHDAEKIIQYSNPSLKFKLSTAIGAETQHSRIDNH